MENMYVTKRTVIEARQIQDDDFTLWEWMGEAYKGHSESEGQTITMKVQTDRGLVEAQHGDWIIKGTEGEFYPCSDEVFQKKYEKLERPPIGTNG
jgi:hypothetical protein